MAGSIWVLGGVFKDSSRTSKYKIYVFLKVDLSQLLYLFLSNEYLIARRSYFQIIFIIIYFSNHIFLLR